ncbi:STAS domain-containing protein [Rhodovulum sp. YNF3179]|uniref:STAS domain-containing protein n=1 Tax=Rhodovulum sp. YNF3179 TaxID=3425127 RepID=UPI003D328B73
MQLESEEHDDVLVLRPAEPRLDAAVAIQFKDAVRARLTDATRRVILDLSRVEFLDSSGLGAVVAVMKFAGPDRGFALAGLTPAVDKVFRLTRMDQVFRIHPDLATALGVGNGQ